MTLSTDGNSSVNGAPKAPTTKPVLPGTPSCVVHRVAITGGPCAGTLSAATTKPVLPGNPSCVVHRVAITGGPCAGKTTALAEVAERLRSRGFGVFIVPEAATLLFTGGASVADATEEHILNFQTQLLKTQMTLEDGFAKMAQTSRQHETFVLCDRGVCDGRAYMSPELWQAMLRRNQWHMVDIRDARYDLVVHLVTAADGAREYYTLDNNKVRSESPDEACLVDKLTQTAWVGHPHLRIVDNRTRFREKINRVDTFISQLAGLHLSRRVVRKFLLIEIPVEHKIHRHHHEGDESDVNSISKVNTNTSGGEGVDQEEGDEDVKWWKSLSMPLRVEHFHVEQTFLSTGLGDEVQESVRRRGKNGVFTYVHKIRQKESETKRQITVREYNSLLPHADVSRTKVRIRRQCFLHDGTYFVMDCVCNISPKIRMLRCHSDCADENVNIPPWFNVEKEVTGERNYSMHSLATHVFAQ